ncbi:hypothetical protein AMELA_G00293880 [Ameiurus melas]|uniref:Uncharacterized protein n=1 Tax=Ameiurus melas TaxID=219545 RepID=A0A7J5ZM68_AMEME|nr:hypothetical protein AMELA_G00293880 [Ameiurus melas]
MELDCPRVSKLGSCSFPEVEFLSKFVVVAKKYYMITIITIFNFILFPPFKPVHDHYCIHYLYLCNVLPSAMRTGTLSMVCPALCPMLFWKGSRFPVTLKRSQQMVEDGWMFFSICGYSRMK